MRGPKSLNGATTAGNSKLSVGIPPKDASPRFRSPRHRAAGGLARPERAEQPLDSTKAVEPRPEKSAASDGSASERQSRGASPLVMSGKGSDAPRPAALQRC